MLTEFAVIGLWVLVGVGVYVWVIRDHFGTVRSLRAHLAVAALGAGLLAPGVVLGNGAAIPMPALIAAVLGVGINGSTEMRAILVNIASWAVMTMILSIASYLVQRIALSATVSTNPL